MSTRSSSAATSPTSAFSSPLVRSRFIISELPRYRPIGIVAAQLLARRWLLYLCCCVVVFALEALFVHLVHVKFAWFYAALIGMPLINAAVIVNAGADAAGDLPTFRARVERLLERGWAVIVLDVGITLVGQIGFQSLQGADALSMLQGILVMFLAAMLVYAEPFACLEKETHTATIVPFAILRSMMLAWVNISRVFSLFAVQIAVTILGLLLYRAVSGPGSHVNDLISLAYDTLTSAFLAALFAVAYLDTLSQERISRS